jgi:predicted RNase H-like nuclease
VLDSQQSPLIAVGVDGARAGWVAACLYGDSPRREQAKRWSTSLELFGDIEALAAFRERASDRATVAIDVPIGLLDSVEFRPCDLAARRLLKTRANAVFAPPARYMLAAASDYAAIRALVAERRETDPTSKSLSAQAGGIAPKVAQVDAFVRNQPAAEAWLWECHPELSFLALNDGAPIAADKRSPAGLVARLQLVCNVFADAEAQLARAPWPGNAVALSDALDAYAALSTAVVCARGEQEELGDGARDSAGLPMRMAL